MFVCSEDTLLLANDQGDDGGCQVTGIGLIVNIAVLTRYLMRKNRTDFGQLTEIHRPQ